MWRQPTRPERVHHERPVGGEEPARSDERLERLLRSVEVRQHAGKDGEPVALGPAEPADVGDGEADAACLARLAERRARADARLRPAEKGG